MSGIRIQRGHPNVLIFCHGGGNTKNGVAIVKLAEKFSQDYDVVAFDLRGYGRSGGKSTAQEKEVNDLKAVIRYARRQGYEKIAAIGDGFGAGIVIVEAAKYHDVDSVIAISTTDDFHRLERFPQFNPRARLSRLFQAVMRIIWKVRMAKPGLLSPIDVADNVSPIPLLIIHGDRDGQFDPNQPKNLYWKAREPKRLVVLEGGGHSLAKLYPKFSDEIEREIGTWLDAHWRQR